MSRLISRKKVSLSVCPGMFLTPGETVHIQDQLEFWPTILTYVQATVKLRTPAALMPWGMANQEKPLLRLTDFQPPTSQLLSQPVLLMTIGDLFQAVVKPLSGQIAIVKLLHLTKQDGKVHAIFSVSTWIVKE